MDLTFAEPPPADVLRAASGVSEVHVDGSLVRLVAGGSTAELFARAAPYGITGIVSHEPDLEEIFLTYYGKA